MGAIPLHSANNTAHPCILDFHHIMATSTPAWTNGDLYTWVGPTTGGNWSDVSNWSYDGAPATHVPDTQTNQGTVTIPSGVTVTVSSATSTLSGVNIKVAGTLDIASGTSALAVNNLEVASGGTANIQRPLTANNVLQVDNGGTATFANVSQDWSGYPGLKPSIATGGTLNFDNSNITLGSVSGSGIAGNLNISNGSTVKTASNSTTITGPITVNGAGTSFTDSSALQSTLTLNDGAKATITTYPTDGTKVVFGTGNNTLILPSDQYAANKLVLANLKEGDSLGVNGQTVTSATMTSDNVKLTTSNGTVSPKSVTYDSSYKNAPTDSNPVTVNTSNGNGVICFLAGSMIRTQDGEVAVETLRLGDSVVVYVDGREDVRTVTWAGRRHMTVRPGPFADEAGYPVRILKDAIAPGMPHTDLLVTAEHCLFLDGKFVPARMLINGRSIHYDTSITSYDYFHIETADHSVIMANGLLTESFLDTGNRGDFRQDGNVFSIGGSVKSWNDDAAAPLTTDRTTVEPLFRAIEARADMAGLVSQADSAVLTQDADLHLMTEDGTIIRKTRETNGYAMFMLPEKVRSVRLMSRTSRPSDVIGPFVDDRRELGVLVGQIALYEAGSTTVLPAHLAKEELSGWSVPEGATMRWTTGHAAISLPSRSSHSIAMLAVQVLSNSSYRVAAEDKAIALTA
ncbi:MAG: Hint domain-containing protein [Gluconobacter cerinus]|uniref:Hint domain-containing protein n=1 Tax=Gluconobacter cerinus TaxID=38307 RepID=UPI0039E7538C